MTMTPLRMKILMSRFWEACSSCVEEEVRYELCIIRYIISLPI